MSSSKLLENEWFRNNVKQKGLTTICARKYETPRLHSDWGVFEGFRQAGCNVFSFF